MLAAIKTRYDAFAQRVLESLSEIERRDVRAFDRWFYAKRGWQWLIGIVVVTTLVAWLASQLPWNMSFGEAAIHSASRSSVFWRDTSSRPSWARRFCFCTDQAE